MNLIIQMNMYSLIHYYILNKVIIDQIVFV